MAGQVALAAKFLARRHEADAEEPLPDPVYDHAGRERVLRSDEPPGQSHAIKPPFCGQVHRAKYHRHALRDLVAEVLPVAAKLDLRHPPLVARKLLKHRHRDRRHLRQFLAQVGDDFSGRLKFGRFRHPRRWRRLELGNLRDDTGDFLLDGGPLRVDRLPGKRRQGRLVFTVCVGRIVEDRVELEVLLLRERVVLVVVALAAAHRRAHPRAHGRVDAVDDRHRAKLLVDRATFAVAERVAVEGRRDPVVERRIRQQVTGQLLERELVERHVGVEGLHHPVAPAPNCPRRIIGVAGAVGIAGQVEPLPGHVLAIAVVGQQTVDELLDGVG